MCLFCHVRLTGGSKTCLTCKFRAHCEYNSASFSHNASFYLLSCNGKLTFCGFSVLSKPAWLKQVYYVPLGPDIPYQAIVDTRSNTCKRHYCNFEPTNKKRQYGSEKYLFFFLLKWSKIWRRTTHLEMRHPKSQCPLCVKELSKWINTVSNFR